MLIVNLSAQQVEYLSQAIEDKATRRMIEVEYPMAAVPKDVHAGRCDFDGAELEWMTRAAEHDFSARGWTGEMARQIIEAIDNAE